MIELQNIEKKYNEGKSNEVFALRGVDLSIADGEAVAIMGVSGSGKSTLMHIIGCLDTPTAGEYLLDEKDTRNMTNDKLSSLRNKKFGFILQDYGLVLRDSVYDNVIIPLYFNKSLRGAARKEMVNAALEQLGIADLAKRKVGQLSGGQRQRVAIARAVVNNPDVIIADEPTGALDSVTASDIMSVLVELNKKGKTIIMVTHDKKMAEKMNRIVYIVDGKMSDKLVEEVDNAQVANVDNDEKAENAKVDNGKVDNAEKADKVARVCKIFKVAKIQK
ncbi:MAG: ABC transporter ATP-binding protein [Clostridia bacterium]